VEKTLSRAGDVVRLDLLPPDRTEIIPGRGADLVSHIRMQRIAGSYRDIDWDKVLWFRDPHPLDPYSGVTPLESAGMSVELDARLYNVSFMRNDGRPGGVLAVKNPDGTSSGVSDTEMDRVERKFGKGPTAAGALSVIAGELSYVDLATRPRDMQYGQTSRNSKIELLSAYGVPESVLGFSAERTFDNADNELYVYWTRTMPAHNEIVVAGFDEDSSDDLDGFLDTSSVEVLERAERAKRVEARTEVERGLRSIWSYAKLAGFEDEIEETPMTRALYVPQGKTPIPAVAADAAALGLGEPTSPPPAPALPEGGPPGEQQTPAAAGGAAPAEIAASDRPTPPAEQGTPPAEAGTPRTGGRRAPRRPRWRPHRRPRARRHA
jgi:Phage portal protein